MTDITTAADLLARAERISRELRRNDTPVTLQQWAAFDVTVHRLLTELLGEHGIGVPRDRDALRAVIDRYPQPLTGLLHMTNSEPQPTPRNSQPPPKGASTGPQQLTLIAQPVPDSRRALDVEALPQITDPNPMARLTCAFGALADLLNGNPGVERTEHDMDGLVDTTRRVLAIAALAAHHTIAWVPLANVERPMRVGLHVEGCLDSLTTDRPVAPRWLHSVAAAPAHAASSHPARGFNLVVAEWMRTSAVETSASVPSIDSVRTLTRQAGHLLATIDELNGAGDIGSWDPVHPSELRDAASALIEVDLAWPSGASTLVRPAHAFVDASRDLHESLEELRLAAAGLDDAQRDAAMSGLLRASSHLSRQFVTVRTLPERLACAGLLFAPARSLTPASDRLDDRRQGRHIPTALNDLTELVRPWHEAIDRFLHVNRALMHPDQPGMSWADPIPRL